MLLTEEDLPARWRAMRLFVLVALGWIVLGGLVAAVTGPTAWSDGSWAAAFLVLVAGVAQVGLGVGQALLAARSPTRRTTAWELATWNGGSIAVLAGTVLAGRFAGPWGVSVVVAGGAALFGALVLFLGAVRRSRARAARWLVAAYRLLAAVLAVSIPVGLALSVVRHG